MKKNPLAESLAQALAAHISPVLKAIEKGDEPKIEPVMVLRPVAADSREYELLVYGDIGESWWGESVTAKSVVDQLNALGSDVSQINIRVNSYGGSVSDGLAIYNALRRAKARKVVTVDGVAMSSASLIAMAGDEVLVSEASMFMVHAPWGGAVGNARDMRQFADVLDTFAEAMAGAYARKTGKTREDVLALLTDGEDHYYTGSQAVSEGFADGIVDVESEPTTDEQARAFAAGLLQRFLTKAPEDIARVAIAAAHRPRPGAQSVAGASRTEGDTRTTTQAAETGGTRYPTSELRQRAAALLSDQPTEGEPPMPAPNAAADPAEIQAQAIAAVRARNEQITAALAGVIDCPGIRDLQTQALADPSMTVDQVNTKALALLGAQAQAASGGSPRVENVVDSRDKFIDGVSNAAMARAGLAKPEAGNEYSGINLQHIIRACLIRSGQTGVDRLSGSALFDRIQAAHGSSDFPLLVANTANKALRAAYEMAPQTWRTWCGVGEVSDFKANSRIQVGSFNSLAEIKPNGEYTYGNLSEEAESITAITKGKALALTRQLVINDDLGAFMRAARVMGFAAQRTVNEDAYARLHAATVMSDGGALFNATAVTTAGGHANLTSSGTAISATSIGVGRSMMSLQKDKSLRSVLNLSPRFLLCPNGKAQVAYDVVKPFPANTGGSNFVIDMGLTIVSDALLDANSGTAWYLIADPNIAPVIEVDFLDGNETPYVAETVDWETDAMKMKVRLDYGVQAIDWRAGYKNAGA